MSKQLKLLAVILAVMVSFTLFGSGCSDDDDIVKPTPNPDDDSIVNVANAELADMMNEMINITLENADSSFRPSDIDFQSVYDLYRSALEVNPDNAAAKFGAAFTGMMLFLQDDDLNALVDEIKNVVDTGTFFPTRMLPQIGIGGDLTTNSVPLAPSKFNTILPDFTKFDNMVMAAAVTDPKISDLQSVLESGLMPKIEQAIGYMNDLVAETDFLFYITPSMQGNPGADSIEIDNTDIYLFRAVLYALHGSLNIFFARDLDFVSYDIAGLEDAIQQNSSFLSLRTGSYMANAKLDLLAAVNSIKSVLNGLITEANSGENQDDDLIRAYPDDVADYEMVLDSINYYLTYFNGPKDIVITWEELDCFDTLGFYICTTYTDSFVENVDVSKFFDNPIDNPKHLLPSYNFGLTDLPDLATDFAAAHWDEPNYWSNMYTVFQVTPGDEAALADSVAIYQWQGYYPLPTVGTPEFYEQLASYPYREQFRFGWHDLYTYNSGSKYFWHYESSQSWDYYDFYYGDTWLESCYGWTASSYTDWTFPNPTFNGLLPNMTSLRLKELSYPDTLSWEQGTCDTISVEDIAYGLYFLFY